jgi:hypothetical protein
MTVITSTIKNSLHFTPKNSVNPIHTKDVV